jgi:hypothetical protein
MILFHTHTHHTHTHTHSSAYGHGRGFIRTVAWALTLAHARGDGHTARGGWDERGAGRDGYDTDTQRGSDGNGTGYTDTRIHGYTDTQQALNGTGYTDTRIYGYTDTQQGLLSVSEHGLAQRSRVMETTQKRDGNNTMRSDSNGTLERDGNGTLERDGNGTQRLAERSRGVDTMEARGGGGGGGGGVDTQSLADPRGESSRVRETERSRGMDTMETTLSAELLFRLWLPCVVSDSALRGVWGSDAGGEGGRIGGVGGQRRGQGGEELRGGLGNMAYPRESRVHRGVRGVVLDANGQGGRHVCGEVLTVSEVLRYVCACLYMYMYIGVCVCVFVCVCVCVRACVVPTASVCGWVCLHAHTYTHAHIHTYTHTHIHTYTHTRIHTQEGHRWRAAAAHGGVRITCRGPGAAKMGLRW